MRGRPPRSTQSRSSAASDVYKRQDQPNVLIVEVGNGAGVHRLERSNHVPGEKAIIAERAPPHRWEFKIRVDCVGCCLLYTSDAADDLLCVDLGGRRII